MKKIFSALLLAVIMATTACGSKTPAATGNFNYKVGTASYTHTNDSYGYTEGKNGRGAVSTTLVAAVFDENGQIVRISIDEVESNIGFDNTGRLADFTPGEVKSKKELGDAYGMKAASSIGKEWYQQIESLEKWLEGRKVNTIIGGAAAKLGDMLADNSDMGYTDQYGTYTPGSASEITRGSTNSANSDGASGNTANSSMKNDSSSGGMMGDIASGANSIINDMADGGENYTGSTADTSWMDEDLKASVTIDTTYIQKAIEKAYRNAK
ncbi:MAG: hypothetical protein IKK99_09960 [Oscillospiraceae bacterium]|nr:hypothetical protein [Oscillospiraceae bacterium]